MPPTACSQAPNPPPHTSCRRSGMKHTVLRLPVIVAAVVGVIPALLDIVAHVRHGESAGISRWALALLRAGEASPFLPRSDEEGSAANAEKDGGKDAEQGADKAAPKGGAAKVPEVVIDFGGIGERIVDALGEILAAAVTGEHHGLGRRNLLLDDPRPEHVRPFPRRRPAR